MEHKFNLICDPWIPAVTLEGNPAVISLREALVNAPAYQRVSASLPHTSAAVMRLLLAVLHRVFGPEGPDEWEDLWVRRRFDAAALDAYFAAQAPRFELFSPERPFFQRRHPQLEEKPAQALLQVIGGGDTYTLFDHRLDSTRFVLSPADAALMLITAHSFGLAGLWHPQLKLNMTDAPCSRAIVFFVEGNDLFENLMFNLVAYNRGTPSYFAWKGTDDPPAWEMEDPYGDNRTVPNGYLDYLTWQNRKIYLIPEEQNGQTVVARVVIAPGLALSSEVRNPMHLYTISEGKKKANDSAVRVLRFTEGRALWRDSNALFARSHAAVDRPLALDWMRTLTVQGILPKRQLKISAYGMCTEPGKQKVYFYRGESFDFKNEILHNQELTAVLNTALDRAENLRQELWIVLNRLAEQVIALNSDREDDRKDGRKPDSKDVQGLIHHWNAEGLYWDRLETPFYRFLDRLPEDPQQALLEWNDALRAALRYAYSHTVDGLGLGLNALKAAAKTRGRLEYGLVKVLGPQPKEE